MIETAKQDDVLTSLKAGEQEIIAIRRDIHAHPETAFEEGRTAGLVAAKLREWGIDTHVGIATTGVVGTVRGKREGKRTIGLRADMDALFIHEKTGLSYESRHAGKMHACGHDGHTAMLLGAARHLAEHRDFGGTVHLIFQPAEERGAGGRVMIEEGLFDRFDVDAVYGMHNEPGMPAGRFGIRAGAMLAAGDVWTVIFHGTGGHGGAAPHRATDPTIVQAHFVLAAQSIIGRNISALEPAVISVGHIAGGDFASPSIIPADLILVGTARSYAPTVRDTIERRLREVATALADMHGCRVTVKYERGYPPLVNHPEQTRIAANAAMSLVGASNVNTNNTQITAAEDFAFMLQAKPGAFMLIGNGFSPDGTFHNVHTPHYDFNDEILSLGSAYWVTLVRQELVG